MLPSVFHIYPLTHPSIHSSIHSSIYVCLSVYLSVCLSVCLSIYVSLSLCLSFSVNSQHIFSLCWTPSFHYYARFMNITAVPQSLRNVFVPWRHFVLAYTPPPQKWTTYIKLLWPEMLNISGYKQKMLMKVSLKNNAIT